MHIFCKKIPNGGQNGDHFQNGGLKSCQLQLTTVNFTELTNVYVFCVISMLMNSKHLNLHIFGEKIQKGDHFQNVNYRYLRLHRINRFEWFLCQTICLWTQEILILTILLVSIILDDICAKCEKQTPVVCYQLTLQ